MCELFGMSFNMSVTSTFSFRGFTKRGNFNRDGWGIALYPDGGNAAQVFKEPTNSNNSSLANYIKSTPALSSKLYLAHVRMMSCGEPAYCNTHPFSRESNGKEYCFAHNGTLKGKFREYLNLGRYKTIGGTDSEYAFCHLLSFIENNIVNWDKSSFKLLHNKLQDINTTGRFNCLFSDGEYLFCYHDIDGYNGLCHVRRKAPFVVASLKDEDYDIDFQVDKRIDQTGYVIATQPLTNEEWVNFASGELIVFKNGVICYSSECQISNAEVEILKVIRTAPHKVCIKKIVDVLDLHYAEVSSCIEKLVDKGFIQQDSRDTVAPLDKMASYYTVRAKIHEINQMLL